MKNSRSLIESMEIQPRTGHPTNAIANRLAAIKLPHPLRVGIDGVSASGKTVLADELAVVLQKMNREVIRTGIDGFHNPPEIRHRRGSMSVEGYVEDSFDYCGGPQIRPRILWVLKEVLATNA